MLGALLSFILLHLYCYTEWANKKKFTPVNTHFNSKEEFPLHLEELGVTQKHWVIGVPVKLLNQKTTGICIKDVKKALFRALVFQGKREKYMYKSHNLVPLQKAVALLRGEMQNYYGMSQPCKAKATAETKNKSK